MSDTRNDNIITFPRMPIQEARRTRPRSRSKAFAIAAEAMYARGSRCQGYRPGQDVICRIRGIEPGGYTVKTIPDGLPGYLISSAKYKIGEQVLGTFIGIDTHRWRMDLSDRFANRNR